MAESEIGSGVTMLARAGYAARGVVYIIIGYFAVLAAWGGGGGQTTDSKGALLSLLDEPFGTVLLGIVAVGLIGYALWRLIQGAMDTDGHGSDAKGLAIRGGLLISAVTHVLLAIFAFSLIFGWGSGGGGGGGGGTQDWTAWLMRQPYGRWLVALVGLAVLGAGIAHIVKGWKAKFEKYLRMDRQKLDTARPICRFGLIARGVVFLIIGALFLVAAWQIDPSQAQGLAGALQTLQEQAYGWVLLGVIALGLVAFGIYSLIEAIWRNIDHPFAEV
ncbi:MAG TPA: DUF1206 domain-containing protein [Geminicoccaceae bacterium]